MSKIVPPKMLQMCFQHRHTGEMEIIEQKLISTTKELIDWTREVTNRHKLHFDGSIRWALREGPDIMTAVITLTQALRQDKNLFQGYKNNIAVEFVDEIHRRNELKWTDINDIANTAAENFLTRWIKQEIVIN